MQPLKMFFYYLIEVMPWYRFPNYFCQLPPTSYLAVSSGQIGTHTHAHACARVHTHTHTHTEAVTEFLSVSQLVPGSVESISCLPPFFQNDHLVLGLSLASQDN